MSLIFLFWGTSYSRRLKLRHQGYILIGLIIVLPCPSVNNLHYTLLTPVHFSRHECWCGPCWLYINSLENIKQTFDQGQWLARTILQGLLIFGVKKIILQRKCDQEVLSSTVSRLSKWWVLGCSRVHPTALPDGIITGQARQHASKFGLKTDPHKLAQSLVMLLLGMEERSQLTLWFDGRTVAGNWKTLLT